MCATTLILGHESEAEWLRLRTQREYDFFLGNHGRPPITASEPFELKAHELVSRYLTAAERKFQRDYRLLEHHWKTHHKSLPEPRKAIEPPDPEPSPPKP